jgi:hypothetical protein
VDRTRHHTDPPEVTDADLRWALRALDTVEERGGPSALRDCLASATAAAHTHRELTLGQSLSVPELSRRLTALFGAGRDRADRIAREHLAGSRRASVVGVLRQYLDLVEAEAEQRREREQPPAPITITSPADVPAAVALAQGRRHAG